MILLGAEDMAALNEQFLGHAGPTDVITFDLHEPEAPAMPGEPAVFGEIYVCAEVAQEAAAEYSTGLGRELVLYIVHGMLHLAGEDDTTPAAQESMRAAERNVMAVLDAEFDLDRIV